MLYVILLSILSFNDYSNVYRIDSNGNFIVEISPYSKEISFGEQNSAFFLTETEVSALNVAPKWIRKELFDVLTRVSSEKAEQLANIILKANQENPLYTDEVAFVVAHLSIEDLEYNNQTYKTQFDSELILENVRTIYETDPLLSYAQLKEYGEGTDNFYTTVELKMKNTTWEVPKYYYYWYIVHPRLTDDSALYINPHTGNPKNKDEGGMFWRSYFATETPDPDYSYPFDLKIPNEITNLDIYEARDFIYITNRDPIVEVKDASNNACLLHIAVGKGMLYATTLDFENYPHDLLLENLLKAGFGYGSMIKPSSSIKFAVFRSKDTFGKTEVENLLNLIGFNYDVLDSTAISNISSSDDLSDYYKIIVPSDQTEEFYDLLVSKKDILEDWLSNTAGSTFLFLGARDDASFDWKTKDLPFFISANEGTNKPFITGGYPKWTDVMILPENAEGNYVWDGTTYTSLSSERKFTDSDMLLDRLGYLVSQNLEMRFGEIPHSVYWGPDGDCIDCAVRTAYPQRIAYQHYGNCGELQDLSSAFARTALIPTAGVGGITEDHVWNEFYLNDEWVPFQVGWSDGPTDIAIPGNRQDKDYSGGKDLAIVYRTRPDGKWENVTERYSNTITLNFTVANEAEQPVPGAEILVASENWYDPSELTLAIVIHTDFEGKASLKVGDFQNIYARVSYQDSAWPDPQSVTMVLCDETEGSCPSKAPWDQTLDMPLGDNSSSSYEIPITLSTTIESQPVVTVSEDSSPIETTTPTTVLSYTISSTSYKSLHLDTLGSSYTDEWIESVPPTLYLMDSDNYELYISGNNASAIAELITDADSHQINLYGYKHYFIVSKNLDDFGNISKYFEINLSVEDYQSNDATETNDNNSSDSGCSCSQNSEKSQKSAPILFLFMLSSFFILKRKFLF